MVDGVVADAGEAEAEEALKRFKLAWKLALKRHCGKQIRKAQRAWIVDVFGHPEKLMDYFKTATLPERPHDDLRG